jgi:hypothetical protein
MLESAKKMTRVSWFTVAAYLTLAASLCGMWLATR